MSKKREKTSIGSGDLLVCAPTGSGKTIAYVLPIIQALENRIIPQTRALILLPSRDLALQVYNIFIDLLSSSSSSLHSPPLRVAICLGKSSFDQEHRNLLHPFPVDIIISTPGRLVDHLNANLPLFHLQYLIIDEADRLLNVCTFYILFIPLSLLPSPFLAFSLFFWFNRGLKLM